MLERWWNETALMASDTKHSFFEDRVFFIPKSEARTDVLMRVTISSNAIFALLFQLFVRWEQIPIGRLLSGRDREEKRTRRRHFRYWEKLETSNWESERVVLSDSSLIVNNFEKGWYPLTFGEIRSPFYRVSQGSQQSFRCDKQGRTYSSNTTSQISFEVEKSPFA